MSSAYIGFEGSSRLDKKYVHFKGTDDLKAGYVLCYDTAAKVGTAADSIGEQLGSQVVKPATANLGAIAGIVVRDTPNVSGSGMPVEIAVPKRGEFIEAFTKVKATAFSTYLGAANGAYSLAAIATPAAPADKVVGVAAQGVDTSTTAANQLIKFT